MEAEHGINCNCGQTFQNPEELTKHVNLQDLELQSDYTPRKPNQEELEELTEWYVNNHGHGFEEAVSTVNQCYSIVIDGYITGCPGYAGKILIEIGSAGPSFYTVYTWSDDRIQRRKQATELRQQSR